MKKRIIIAYSNEKLATKVMSHLNNSVEVIAVTNLSNDSLGILRGIKGISPERIGLLDFEYVLLIWEDEESREELTRLLIGISGIPQDKIIDFCWLYRLSLVMPKVKKLMQNPNYKKLDGLVLGMSHAECGIVSKMLPGVACNVATGAQDLFYNYKVLEYLNENYPERICSLKYVIIDMWDYPYFNYDVSQSSEAANYILNYDGWDEDSHNFDKNKDKTVAFADLIEYRYGNISRNKDSINVMHGMFDDVYEINDYSDVSDDFKVRYLTAIMPEDCEDGYKINNALSENMYEETIRENKGYFENIISLLHRINPKIKVKIVLVPRFYEIEKKTKITNALWETRFYEIIREYSNIYNLQIYDFKELTKISSNRNNYRDLAHLNATGAKAFTEYLVSNVFTTDELMDMNYKKRLRIMFDGISDDELCELIYECLEEKYDIEIGEGPELFFYSADSEKHCNQKCIKVFISDGLRVPNFNETDYAISLYNIKYRDRHFELSGNWKDDSGEILRLRQFIHFIAESGKTYNKDPMECSVQKEFEREKRINDIMKKYFRV